MPWSGPELSEDQFHEHLEDIRQRLGITFERDAIALPSGHRIPTVGQRFFMRNTPEEPKYSHRSISAYAPSETGRMHALTSIFPNLRQGEDDLDTLWFATGHKTRRASWGMTMQETRYTPGADSPVRNDPHWFRDPAKFHADVIKNLTTAPPPDPDSMAYHRNILEAGSRLRGLIQVQHDLSTNLTKSRLYHFHTATGRLEFMRKSEPGEYHAEDPGKPF